VRDSTPDRDIKCATSFPVDPTATGLGRAAVLPCATLIKSGVKACRQFKTATGATLATCQIKRFDVFGKLSYTGQ
jgi:hypothetical protein